MTTSARKPISKKIRFEIFKRDKFRCQYCGKTPPETTLCVDHIMPVAKGGTNDLLNLITACQECNSGKRDKTLDDETTIAKQKKQLDELQERRQQLAMMVEWQKELINIEDEAAKQAQKMLEELCYPNTLNDVGFRTIKKHVNRYGFTEVVEAIRIAHAQYADIDEKGNVSIETAAQCLNYIPKICNVRRGEIEKPYLRDLLYIRGILKNRFNRMGYDVMKILEMAYKSGIELDYLKYSATTCRSYRDWSDEINTMIMERA